KALPSSAGRRPPDHGLAYLPGDLPFEAIDLGRRRADGRGVRERGPLPAVPERQRQLDAATGDPLDVLLLAIEDVELRRRYQRGAPARGRDRIQPIALEARCLEIGPHGERTRDERLRFDRTGSRIRTLDHGERLFGRRADQRRQTCLRAATLEISERSCALGARGV